MQGISGLMWILFRLQLRGSAGLRPASFIGHPYANFFLWLTLLAELVRRMPDRQLSCRLVIL